MRRVILVSLSALVVVLAGAPTLLGGLARGRIESMVRDALHTNVSIGDVSLGWLSGVQVGKVLVEPRAVGKPGFSIGSITAKPELAALLRGRVEVPDLVVKHVTLNLTRPPKKEHEEEEAEEPEPAVPEAIPGFGLRATIEDITIIYGGSAWDRPARVENLGPVTIAATSEDATHIEVASGSSIRASVDLRWAKDGKKLKRRERSVSGEITLDHADLAEFTAAAGPWLDALQGIADGRIRFQTAGKAVETTGRIDISKAAVALRGRPGPHRLADLSIKHDLRCDVAGTAWSGLIELGAARADLAALSDAGEALRIERLDLRARLSGNLRADIERLSVKADFGSIEGSGQVSGGHEPEAATAQLEAHAAVDRLARWLGGMPELTGSLTSKARVVLAADGAIEVRGSTTLADFGAKDVPGVGAVHEREIVFKHDCDWGGDAVRMRDVSLTSSFATAKCTGSLQPKAGGGAPEGQVDFELGADLDVIAGLLGEHLAIKPKGKLAVTGKITGAEDGTALDIALKGDHVLLSGGSLTSPLDLGNLEGSCAGQMSSDRSSLAVRKWSLRSKVAGLAGSFEATRLHDRHGPMAATVNGTLEADLLLAAVSTTKPKAPIGRVQITADATSTDAAWKIRVTNLAGAGVTGQLAATFPHADVPAGAATLEAKLTGALETIAPFLSDSSDPPRKGLVGKVTANLQGTFTSATGVWDLKTLAASGPGAMLTGRAAIRPGSYATFDLQAAVKMEEAAPILALVAPSVQGSGAGMLRASGHLSFAKGARPEASQATFELKVDRLKTEVLDLERVEVEAVLEGGIAKTKKATAGMNGGTARLDATVDLRREVPEWKANANVDRVQITKEMQPAIARAVPIFSGVGVTLKGVAGCTLDVQGLGETWEAAKPTLTGLGLISLSSARLSESEILAAISPFVGLPRELAFDDFQSRFKIENGAVRQDRLVLTSKQVDLAMSGTTSLEGRLDYVVGVKPKGGVSDTWRRLGPALDREGFLAMRLQGDVRHPSLKPPKLGSLIGGAVEDVLKGGLDDLLKKKKKPN